MPLNVAVPVEMREVTDDEIAFYKDNGWVVLRGLIPRELCTEMLDSVKDLMLQEEVNPAGADGINDREPWRDWHFMARDDHVEPFYSLVRSKQIGVNAMRLIGRDVPVNFHADLMAVKMP